MKIAILTQPLGHNYGGLLQAFALQKYLRDQGHEVQTLDRRPPDQPLRALLDYTINTAKYLLGRIGTVPTRRKQEQVYRELARFREQHISLSPCITSERALRDYYRQNPFDAYIVGSDQVWRPRYSPSLGNFFLDFLDDIGSPARRLSYAASFGVDEWEFSPRDTDRCRDLLGRFHAVSVREQSGVRLCEQHLGRTAECIPDPTFLLERGEYETVIDNPAGPDNQGKVLTYVLDTQPSKQQIVHRVVDLLGRDSFTIKPRKSLWEVRKDTFDQSLYPGVGAWLQGFRDADFVVTDSFHGTVFSILFNKPFIAVGNRTRGLSRFQSLLTRFGLLDRLVEHADDITTEQLQAEIDWPRVNTVRRQQQALARQFLDDNLREATP
ncbi:polysaccharide pyruvyl transferase family protein [Marinobacter sp. M1N3S26]|uniref:polysaccharide pyruvyl transferase family protein n=1 Tax=Marinobacter sp. M1N3S26 TaxID=3382299 RepID=UPI00387AE977